MKAFNNRFHTTLYFGFFTAEVALLGLVSLCFIVLSLMIIFQIQKPILSVPLIVISVFLLRYSLQKLVNQKQLRYINSIQEGRRDIEARRLEIE